MTDEPRGGGAMIALSFVAGLMLTIIPVPDWAVAYRPDWIALILVYWCMALPHRIGIVVAWVVGLLIDVLTGALLGQHALALVIVAYLALKLHQRIRVYPLWQQALSVLVLLTLHRLILLWINGAIGQPVDASRYWLPAVVGAVLWPWVFLVLRSYRRRFRIA